MPSPSLISPQQLIVVPQKKLQHQITPPRKNTKKLVLQKNVGLTNAREGTREKCRHLGKWKWKQSTCGGHIGVITMLPCSWLVFIVLMPSLACCQYLLDCFFHPAPPGALTGFFNFNFPHHVPLGASTTSGHPPLQHLLLDCFILIFFTLHYVR